MHRFRFFMPLVAALAMTACETAPYYTKFRVTNVRGELIADWTAEGPFRKIESGYRIKAIERTSAPPRAQITRYPNGWNTIIDGPHIVHQECGKPYWLYQLDGQ